MSDSFPLLRLSKRTEDEVKFWWDRGNTALVLAVIMDEFCDNPSFEVLDDRYTRRFACEKLLEDNPTLKDEIADAVNSGDYVELLQNSLLHNPRTRPVSRVVD